MTRRASTTDDTAGFSKLLLTIKETGHRLSLSPRSVWRLIAAGELKVIRCNSATRVTVASIEAFIKKGGSSP